MKVFLSWSGNRSKAVAAALYEWLPLVIQSVEPFFSAEIEKGKQGVNELMEQLREVKFGVVCLTDDNLDTPWIHFEAGAISKMADARLWGFLLGVTPEQVKPPLKAFQLTVADRDDFTRLLNSMILRAAELKEAHPTAANLEVLLDAYWPRLEAKLTEANNINGNSVEQPLVAPRETNAMLAELIDLVRGLDLYQPNVAAQTNRFSEMHIYLSPNKDSSETDPELKILDAISPYARAHTFVLRSQTNQRNGAVELIFSIDPPVTNRKADLIMRELEDAFGAEVLFIRTGPRQVPLGTAPLGSTPL